MISFDPIFDQLFFFSMCPVVLTYHGISFLLGSLYHIVEGLSDDIFIGLSSEVELLDVFVHTFLALSDSFAELSHS